MPTSTIYDSVPDFLEEEDYDEVEPATPAASPNVEIKEEAAPASKMKQTSPQPVETEPTTPPAISGKRVTEGNARLLAFAGAFPGADSEAFSVLSARQDLMEKTGKMVLPTVKGTETRLRKLERLGVLEKYKSPFTKVNHYSLTHPGECAAWSFGYSLNNAASLDRVSKARATHYQMIAHVAAQLASPQGFFRESLGIEPVPFDALISEHQMRAAYEKVNKDLKKKKEAGEEHDFGEWRLGALRQANQHVKDGLVSYADVVEAFPFLLTVGHPEIEGERFKSVHQPDLAVNLDADRNDRYGKNLLIEIELSKKSWDDYHSILNTFRVELEHGFVYSRVVYFTSGPQVGTLLRKVDAAGEFGLFKSGRLVVLPLLDRSGNEIRFNNRISLGGRES